MQRLLLKVLCFVFIVFLVVLRNVAPAIAQEKSDRSFSKLFLVSYSRDESKLGGLYQKEQTPFKLKSENAALRWSLLSTLVPVAAGVTYWILDKPQTKHYTHGTSTYIEEHQPSRLIPVTLIFSGIIFGPSMGYFCAGESWRGTKGIIVRLVLGGGGTLGFLVALAIGSENYNESTSPYDIIGITCGIAILADVIYDIAKVKSTVRKHNDSLQKTTLILAPTYFADSRAYGVGLQVGF